MRRRCRRDEVARRLGHLQRETPDGTADSPDDEDFVLLVDALGPGLWKREVEEFWFVEGGRGGAEAQGQDGGFRELGGWGELGDEDGVCWGVELEGAAAFAGVERVQAGGFGDDAVAWGKSLDGGADRGDGAGGVAAEAGACELGGMMGRWDESDGEIAG